MSKAQRAKKSQQNKQEHYNACYHGDHITAVTADFQACTEDGTVSQIVRQRTLDTSGNSSIDTRPIRDI